MCIGRCQTIFKKMDDMKKFQQTDLKDLKKTKSKISFDLTFK